jgi:hypothetical protein
MRSQSSIVPHRPHLALPSARQIRSAPCWVRNHKERKKMMKNHTARCFTASSPASSPCCRVEFLLQFFARTVIRKLHKPLSRTIAISSTSSSLSLSNKTSISILKPRVRQRDILLESFRERTRSKRELEKSDTSDEKGHRNNLVINIHTEHHLCCAAGPLCRYRHAKDRAVLDNCPQFPRRWSGHAQDRQSDTPSAQTWRSS